MTLQVGSLGQRCRDAVLLCHNSMWKFSHWNLVGCQTIISYNFLCITSHTMLHLPHAHRHPMHLYLAGPQMQSPHCHSHSIRLWCILSPCPGPGALSLLISPWDAVFFPLTMFPYWGFLYMLGLDIRICPYGWGFVPCLSVLCLPFLHTWTLLYPYWSPIYSRGVLI